MSGTRSKRFLRENLGVQVNTTGFAGLPYDILGEIIFQLPESFAIPSKTRPLATIGLRPRLARDSEIFQKIDTLRALSLTCRSLRVFALPAAWSRIDVCSSKFSTYEGDGAANKDLASQVSRQLSIATSKRTGVARFVKIVNLVLVRDAISEKGLHRLARALETFTNLHTIQLTGYSKARNHSISAFEGKSFPNVKTVVISHQFLPLLKCCSSATYIDLGDSYPQLPKDLQEPLDFIYANCSREVEEFAAFQTHFREEVKTYVSTFRKTTVINLHEGHMMLEIMDPAEVKLFGDLPDLKCIRLFVGDDRRFESGEGFLQSKYRKSRQVQRQALRILQGFQPPAEDDHRCIITKIDKGNRMLHNVVSGNCAFPEDCKFYRETGPFTNQW